MLTLTVLWSWTKITGLAIVALVIEHALIAAFWAFALTAGITLTIWLLITLGLYREWRAHGTGYRHEVSEWVSRRPDRRP